MFACLMPGLAARAPTTARIEVSYKGRMYLNLRTGTQLFEQDVTLRQAPDTLIRADRAEGSNLPDGNFDNGHWILSGAVHIQFENAELDADRATVIFADGRIHSIQVQGMPARFSRPTGSTGERNQGRATTIAYDGTRREVRFTGHTVYAFGPYEGTADKPLVYRMDSTELATEQASEQSTSDNSRIIFRFRNMQASARHWRANIDRGTQLLEQGVELRRFPDTLIRADRAEGSNLTDGYDAGHWNLTGAVRIEHDNAQLEADAATVDFAAGNARSIEVHGDPAQFSYPTRVAGRRFQGYAESVHYDGDTREVRVVGHPSRYKLGLDPYSSDKPLLYELDKAVLSTEDNGDPAARVRGTWHPDERVPAPRVPERSTAQ
jgi:lipopolysaccharide export system protein LptA